MVKRMVPLRLSKILIPRMGKFQIPLSWTEGDCIKTSLTVLTSENVVGANTPPATVSDPGGLSSVTPLSYVSTPVAGFDKFLLGDSQSGTDTWPNPCTGSNKVIVYFTGSGVGDQALVNASLPGDNTYIVMEVGARVELNWCPPGSEDFGSWDGFWASSLMPSGCYANCSTAPKAYLTSSV